MEIIIREIEARDYTDVVSIGNDELNCNNTIEEAELHYSRIKDDDQNICSGRK